MTTKRHVLRAEVQQMISDRLLEGRWASGQRLSIDALARDLEVSPTPVREALVSLERSGLIEHTALRGYVIAPPLTSEQIGELIDARGVIEAGALSRAFSDWEDFSADLRRCHQEHLAVAERIRSARTPDFSLVRQHFDADWAFHRTFFHHAGNRYLLGAVETLGTHAHRMRQTWTEDGGELDIDDALVEHARIVTHVENRNHDAATAALMAHLEAVRVRAHGE